MHHHPIWCNQDAEGQLYLENEKATFFSQSDQSHAPSAMFCFCGLSVFGEGAGANWDKRLFLFTMFLPLPGPFWASHHLNRFFTDPYELDTGKLGRHQGKNTRKLHVLKNALQPGHRSRSWRHSPITITFILLIPVSSIGTTAEQRPRNQMDCPYLCDPWTE